MAAVLEGENWVRWNARMAELYPEIAEMIEAFDAGDRPAGVAAAEWLRESALTGESVAYLLIEDDELLGFYALTAGQVELAGGHRRQYGMSHPTQGAILVTQLAKSVRHDVEGARLLQDAIGVAAEIAETIGATVLAVDPYDHGTAEMWKQRFKMRASRTVVPGHDDPEEGALKRLYLPLQS
jgi:hypothetical protein